MIAVHIFVDADLRSGHHGLTELARTADVDFENMNSNEVAVFINTAKDKIKVFSGNGVLAYARFKGGATMNSLHEFARSVQKDGRCVFTQAVRKVLEKHLKQGNIRVAA